MSTNFAISLAITFTVVDKGTDIAARVNLPGQALSAHHETFRSLR